jgi:hypothetical protein
MQHLVVILGLNTLLHESILCEVTLVVKVWHVLL